MTILLLGYVGIVIRHLVANHDPDLTFDLKIDSVDENSVPKPIEKGKNQPFSSKSLEKN